mgnify:CR=1 FL=1
MRTEREASETAYILWEYVMKTKNNNTISENTLYLLGVLLMSKEPLAKKLAAIREVSNEGANKVKTNVKTSAIRVKGGTKIKGYIIRVADVAYWMAPSGQSNLMDGKRGGKKGGKSDEKDTKKGTKQNQTKAF